MQRYTMVLITINALHVSGGSYAHHQELKTVYTASGICRAFTSFYSLLEQAVRSSKSSTNTRCCVYSFELLMMGGGTAWNMCSIYSNKYHCVTLDLVGYAWIRKNRLDETWQLAAYTSGSITADGRANVFPGTDTISSKQQMATHVTIIHG